MRLLRDWRTGVAIAATALAGAYLYGGVQGLGGMAVGLAGATFGMAGLWLMTRLLEHSAGAGKPNVSGAVLPMLAFVAKVPVYYGCGVLSLRIGGAAFACFIAAIVLVYSSSVVWAAAAEPRSTNSPNGSPAD